MLVRIDINRGKIYETWLDYWNEWALAIRDGGVVGMTWDHLPEIEVENLEEAKKKIAYICKPSESLLDKMTISQLEYNITMNMIWGKQ